MGSLEIKANRHCCRTPERPRYSSPGVFRRNQEKNGTDYEPNSLASMQASIDRFLKESGYPYSILNDRAFWDSRSVLEGKARFLREEGKGNRPNRADSLTPEEEEVLWRCGQLGMDTPRAVLNTIWWLLSQHLGLRGREKHKKLRIQDFKFCVSDTGAEYVRLAEGISKTLQSGLREKHRLEKPFMFENKESFCPVQLLKFYISKRPAQMRSTGPLYLAAIERPPSALARSEIWFKVSELGLNTINNIMKTMIQNSPLKDTNKRFTNHSVRKTLVKKLKAKKVPKSDIIAITGHTTEAGLDDYDSGNEAHQESISKKIDLQTIPNQSLPPASAATAVVPLPVFKLNQVSQNDPRLVNPTFRFFPEGQYPIAMANHFSAASCAPLPMPFNYFHPQQQATPAQHTPVQHFHLYSGANLHISSSTATSALTTPVQAEKPQPSSPSPPPSKLRRYNRIVDSSSDSESE